MENEKVYVVKATHSFETGPGTGIQYWSGTDWASLRCPGWLTVHAGNRLRALDEADATILEAKLSEGLSELETTSSL